MEIDLHGGSYLPKKLYVHYIIVHQKNSSYFPSFFIPFLFVYKKNLHHQYNRTKITFSTDFSRKHWSNKSFISAKNVPLHYFIIHWKILHIFNLFSFLICKIISVWTWNYIFRPSSFNFWQHWYIFGLSVTLEILFSFIIKPVFSSFPPKSDQTDFFTIGRICSYLRNVLIWGSTLWWSEGINGKTTMKTSSHSKNKKKGTYRHVISRRMEWT